MDLIEQTQRAGAIGHCHGMRRAADSLDFSFECGHRRAAGQCVATQDRRDGGDIGFIDRLSAVPEHACLPWRGETDHRPW